MSSKDKVPDNYGLIFTFMWIFDSEYDWKRVERMTNIFKEYDADICYVELHAPLEVRLQRSSTENRLNHKPSWRNKEKSENYLRNHGFRCISNGSYAISGEEFVPPVSPECSLSNCRKTIVAVSRSILALLPPTRLTHFVTLFVPSTGPFEICV